MKHIQPDSDNNASRRHPSSADRLLEQLDSERLVVSDTLASDQRRRAALGQFMTPAVVAEFMASMLDVTVPPTELRLLDAGSGTGMLTAAAVAEFCSRPENKRPSTIHVTAWEIDDFFEPLLQYTLQRCGEICQEHDVQFTWDLRCEDFISSAADIIGNNALPTGSEIAPFHVAILNPPYRKLNGSSVERNRLNGLGMGTSNTYSAFVWLALELLQVGGEIVAITPRSFMNGTYFRDFRQALIRQLSFRRIHIYDARDAAFSTDNVLQENVVFHGVRGVTPGSVRVTTSYGPHDTGMTERVIERSELVFPDDKQFLIRVVPDENAARITRGMAELNNRISDLGISVSTGRVVGFRAKERLRTNAEDGDAPMILPRHCRNGFVVWPQQNENVPNALSVSGPDDDLVLPSGWYVLVNRFSAKEDRRRIVASLFDPGNVDAPYVAFDNKLNVLHSGNAGLPEMLAKGLAAFLNSTVVDSYFRQFSGHTQVNAGDLRTLRFPDADALVGLGRKADGEWLVPYAIDSLLSQEIPAMTDSVQATASEKRIEESIAMLKSFGVQTGQLNERSALTFLALLDLGPDQPWLNVASPLRGVTEMMVWMREQYGKSYAPNTRETIRRFTLHQFIGMGLVSLNPDDPTRPVNSPNNAYQVHRSVLDVVSHYGSEQWEARLAAFLDGLETRDQLSQRERHMDMIPVTLPDGVELSLTAGGQNVLVKDIIEQFAQRFVPGGHVIYVGDAGASGRYFDSEYLASLGVITDEAGPMPDVVLHHIEKDWLVIVEAVTSHGPVNQLRRNQLRNLFSNSRCGLVYVTAFSNRSEMRRFLTEIAWETEVWVSDAPTHLIHFDGERFLGPYSDE